MLLLQEVRLYFLAAKAKSKCACGFVVSFTRERRISNVFREESTGSLKLNSTVYNTDFWSWKKRLYII